MNANDKPEITSIYGKTQHELDEHFRAFQAALKRDYRAIKGKDYVPTDSKREIGYHAHLHSKKK